MLFGQTDRYNSFLRHSINNILGSDHRKSMDSARPSRLGWLKHAMRNDSAFVITQLYLQNMRLFREPSRLLRVHIIFWICPFDGGGVLPTHPGLCAE